MHSVELTICRVHLRRSEISVHRINSLYSEKERTQLVHWLQQDASVDDNCYSSFQQQLLVTDTVQCLPQSALWTGWRSKITM